MNLGHGGNISEIARIYNISEDKITDFSANINPVGLCREVKDAMINALDKIERYPDITYYELKNQIAAYEKINRDDIILGNGAAEVIFNIVRAIKPTKALLPAPTFSEYEDALNSIECKIEHYELKDDFMLDNGFINKIKPDIDIIFICNPNNPTGLLTTKNYILRVIKKAKKANAKVVVDESFMDFIQDKVKYKMVKVINDYDNLIVVKSLTKLFAFPGIRVGYGITSNKDIIKDIEKISVPWSINTVAVEGARVALTQRKYIKETINYVRFQKEFLYNELVKFDKLTVYKGEANFLFFKVNGNINLRDGLLKYGIAIRSCNNYKGLGDGYYRIAVRQPQENMKLLLALRLELLV